MKLLFLAALFAAIVPAQPLAYTISTTAGGSTAFDFAEGKPATSFLIPSFSQPAADKQGNFYFSLGNRVIRVTPDGTATTYAGTGVAGSGATDGVLATSAPLNNPGGVLLDPQGRLLIFEGFGSTGNRLRRVELNGTITTIAGNGQVPNGKLPMASADGEGGPATSARVRGVLGAYDNNGNLFILDSGYDPADPYADNLNVRRIGTDGRITTVARGVGVYPAGMASDGTNIYLADLNPAVNRVAKLAGSSFLPITGTKVGFGGDGGPAIAALLNYPSGIAVDSAGNLHVVDSHNNRVRTIRNNPAGAVASGQGIISTSAGTGASGFGVEGAPALTSPLASPSNIAVDAADNIYISDDGSGRYRRFRLNGAFQTIAGLPLTDPLGDGGPATQAALISPLGLSRDAAGNLLIADGARLRKVTRDGLIATIAGQGIQGTAGDNGPALQALFQSITSAVQDSAGNVYVLAGGPIRKISPDGTVTLIIGFPGATQDEGPAATVAAESGFALAIDAQNNIYIDSNPGGVRKLSPSGVVTRVLGNSKFTQSPASSGAALSADIAGVHGFAFEANGNILVSDSFHHRILRLTPGGQFTTVAGTYGKSGFSGDGGPAALALLNIPSGLALDAWGNLYVAEYGNNRVRKITPDGTISTIAGSAVPGFIADGGPAVGGQVSPSYSSGAVADPAGNVLLISDNRVRKLTGDKLRAQGVLHAAIQDSGPVAAGLRILVRGAELIPPSSKASLRALFDGQPANIVSQDASQIVTVVPASVAGQSSTVFEVEIDGARTNALTLTVVAARPGILSIANSDGTANAASNPANSGDIVTLLVTGDGAADPSLISVSIGGVPAAIVAAPPADDSGVRPVSLQLPDGVSSGDPVAIAVGDATSPGVAVWLQ